MCLPLTAYRILPLSWGLWVWLAVPNAHLEFPEASLGQWELCPFWSLEPVGGIQSSPWLIWVPLLTAYIIFYVFGTILSVLHKYLISS